MKRRLCGQQINEICPFLTVLHLQMRGEKRDLGSLEGWAGRGQRRGQIITEKSEREETPMVAWCPPTSESPLLQQPFGRKAFRTSTLRLGSKPKTLKNVKITLPKFHPSIHPSVRPSIHPSTSHNHFFLSSWSWESTGASPSSHRVKAGCHPRQAASSSVWGDLSAIMATPESKNVSSKQLTIHCGRERWKLNPISGWLCGAIMAHWLL